MQTRCKLLSDVVKQRETQSWFYKSVKQANTNWYGINIALQNIGGNKNVPGEIINVPVWRLPLQKAALRCLWWCQNKTPNKGPPRVPTETDRSGEKKAISWTHWKPPQQRPLTMHNNAWCSVQSFFFFFSFSFSDGKRKKKWLRVRRDCFPSLWVTGGWWNAGGDLKRRLRENGNQSQRGWRGGRFLKQTVPRSSRRGQVVF